MSTVLPDKPAVEMSVTEHVHEAWRPPLQPLDGKRERVTGQAAGCHSWSEVEAEATTSWRASVGSLASERTERAAPTESAAPV
jgi:hypothetical protein